MLLFSAATYGYSQDTQAPEKIRKDLSAVLSRLEKKMSGIKTLKTGFVQEKELAVFKQKVVLKGTVCIEKPGRLAWYVNEPMKYKMVISQDMISQWDEDTNRVQKISLSKNPAFEAAIGQMQEWFSGAYTPLLKEYEIILLKENPASLKFTPRASTIAGNVIKSVTVVFRKDEQYISRIFIEEKSGDTTNLSFIDTHLNVPLENSVWNVIPDGVR
ncbi:outer membrane lipoprotein carrier protein LolA [sediment metagenome]|uniref:Outer membrane lipoprotein carrier protein LolA n=1 Tax=sediment metagenome TaxID=749907 RepID=D9PNL2_9ZZZZ